VQLHVIGFGPSACPVQSYWIATRNHNKGGRRRTKGRITKLEFESSTVTTAFERLHLQLLVLSPSGEVIRHDVGCSRCARLKDGSRFWGRGLVILGNAAIIPIGEHCPALGYSALTLRAQMPVYYPRSQLTTPLTYLLHTFMVYMSSVRSSSV